MSEARVAESQPLSREFQEDYAKFSKQFDALAEDYFRGSELHSLAKEFQSKHALFLARVAYAWRSSRFPKGTKCEIIDEDYRIVTAASSSQNTSRAEARGASKPEPAQQLAGQVYRRACQACHLRTTFEKSRYGLEQDRREALELARYALRFDPESFDVSYWYMIALGWYLEALSEPAERTLVARTFRESCLRCIRLSPEDPLAHSLLGRYYYSVAGLTWIERTIAKRLLGCELKGTYQDSERQFRVAHSLKDDWMPTGLWMARVLVAQKRPLTEIKPWIELGLSLGCREPSSEMEREELVELGSKLKLI